MDQDKPPPVTNRERQQALRRRRAEKGMTELRGVYLPTSLHAPAKQFISQWLKRHQS